MSETIRSTPEFEKSDGPESGFEPDKAVPHLAICARGVECVAAAELRELGALETTELLGAVRFLGKMDVLYRACLQLRTASRIVRPLKEFAAAHADMLYSQVRRIPWEKFLTLDTTFAVYATIEGLGTRQKRLGEPPVNKKSGPNRPDRQGSKQGLHHSQYAALKIKDAIVDRMRREIGDRPNISREHPDLRIQAHFAAGRCTLSLDATGKSLHERGYRVRNTAAPLKETLAAAIVDLSGWKPEQPLYDPMCGSGTLVIEAARKALRISPNLHRHDFPCLQWPDFDRSLWQRTVQETKQRTWDLATASVRPRIFASDIDPQAIEAAQANAKAAGVANVIHFFRGRIEDTIPPVNDPGVLLTNPPYGERMGDSQEIEKFYRVVSQVWSSRFAGWSANFLAGNLGASRALDLVAVGKHKLFNGPLECRLLQFAL